MFKKDLRSKQYKQCTNVQRDIKNERLVELYARPIDLAQSRLEPLRAFWNPPQRPVERC